MCREDEPRDPRRAAARYAAGERDDAAARDDAAVRDAGSATLDERTQYVEVRIQQAIRNGDFDDLPGAGKPLRLGGAHDPDWWIRRKIERERLTGLGPPALTCRTEHAALDGRLDALGAEQEVREVLEDFNHRVVEARRQLLGGPPVVTPTRDVELEVARWRERRVARTRSVDEGTSPPRRPSGVRRVLRGLLRRDGSDPAPRDDSDR